MKKNLFLLFSFYFFVVQPIFVWILRQIPNMLILGLINLVAILLILLIYKAAGGKDDDDRKETRKAPLNEDKDVLYQSHHHEPAHKKADKKGGAWKTLLAILLGIACYILLMGSSMGYRLIVAAVVALILLALICLVSKNIRGFFTLAGTKTLFLFLALGIIVFGFQFSFLNVNTSLTDYIKENIKASQLFFASTTDTSDAYILTGEGSVIGSGVTSGEETSSDIADLFSGIQSSDVLTQEEPTTLPDTGTTEPVTPTAVGTSLHMGEMIQAVITKYNVPLITTKDVKFTNVSYGNSLYPYFRTAYSKALIGTTTSPTKLALCDTYIVMKGILEGWNVTYTKANVMQKYRDYAKANDKLNGCVQGKVIKDNNL